MIKKTLLPFLIILLSFSMKLDSFADSIPVENIFVDITTDYQYYDELQTLYDKGMIFPNEEGKFGPYDLLQRDEFVGIASEVSCKRCIQPNTDTSFLDRYTSSSFFDIDQSNKYFYCVADAAQNNFVSGYDVGFQCEDGSVLDGERPFCPSNTIVLEEALAVILRMSGILTSQEAEQVRQDIRDGKITENLADDVSPRNLDGSVYSFYPDFQRALGYEIIEYDTLGNMKVYPLVEKVDNKIRPKKSVTKEEFLRIAYVALKANSCIERQENTLSLKMDILDKTCGASDTNCSFSSLKDDFNIYDFRAEVGGVCEQGIRDPDGYIWRFYNLDTGKEIKKYGRYIDNHEFLSEGKWKVFLRVIDNCGNTSEVYNTIVVGGSELKVSLRANPIIGTTPLNVGFTGVASFGKSPYSYNWNFGDASQGLGRIIENIYSDVGIYEAVLSVTDANGNTGEATAIIQTLERNCTSDSDGDGINDCDDLCPLVEGRSINSGCPILEISCENDSVCPDGYSCQNKDFGIGVCLPEPPAESGCVYDGGDIVFGNAIINSCPSNVFLDFRAPIRSCDKVFPAIISPDGRNIYSKGDVFEIE